MNWHSEVIAQLNNHRSIRKFKNMKVEEDVIRQIIQSAQMASTSKHAQAYSIVGVTDPVKQAELVRLTGDQAHVANCSHFMVFCADLHRLESVGRMEGVDLGESLDTLEMFIVATVDAALAAQNAAIAAESLGLGIVYIGGIRNHPAEVCSLLKLPSRVYPVFGMCIGYPDHEPNQKPRLPVEAVYFENEYKTAEIVAPYLHEFNAITDEYYRKRLNGVGPFHWTSRISNAFRNKARDHMKTFLNKQGFPLK